MLGIDVGGTDGTSDGAVHGIRLGTEDRSADDGTLIGMELGADDGTDSTSDGAVLGHDSVVVLVLVLVLIAYSLVVYLV